MAKKNTHEAQNAASAQSPQPQDQQQPESVEQAPNQEAAPAPEKPAAAQRPRVPLSQPVYRNELKLKSLQAQRVAHRSFAPLAGSLFRSDVILRIVGTDDAADELETIIQDLMQPVMNDLEKSQEQARYVLEQNKISSTPDYTYIRSFPVEIMSPQTATFARMIKELDNLIVLLDTLWFNGLLTNKQRSQQTKDWQQRLLRMANRIINFERRARRRALDAGKQAEVDLHAPEAEQEDAEQRINAAIQESEVSPNAGTEQDQDMAVA